MPSALRLATIADRPSSHRAGARRHLRLVVPRTLRVLIADDLELHRAGLRALLEGEEDIVVVGEARRGGHAAALSRALRPDVVVLDLGTTALQVLETAWAIVTDPDLEDVGVLVLTPPGLDGDGAAAGRQGAACRFLTKDVAPADLVAAVRALAFRPSPRAAAAHPCVRRVHRNQGASWNSAI